jgi:hypothetical protein
MLTEVPEPKGTAVPPSEAELWLPSNARRCRKAILPADHKLTKALLAAEQSVHHLAERARAATDQRSRIYLYSELIQS